MRRLRARNRPTSVIASAAVDDTSDMGVACPACIEYLGARNPERSPTIEQYREFLRRFSEPMYASDEELRAAAEDFEDPSEVVYDASWLWRVARGDAYLVHITPTIIHRACAGPDAAHEFTHGVATVEHEGRRALLVFRSEEEAEKYRSATGKHPKEEGFRTATLGLEELGHILEEHECTHVAMPQPWDGEGMVDFFTGPDFIAMLEESVPA